MTVLKQIWGWVSSLAIAFAVTFILGVFVVQPYKVDGHSMDPTLHNKQYMFISKLSHTFSYLPDYEDIVVIDSRVERKRSFLDDVKGFSAFQLFSKHDEKTFYVKRVIGKPGDVIELKDQSLYRNGALVDEPYIKEKMNETEERRWEVPEGHIFVMGDNRNHSDDSRKIGFIPLDHVMGKLAVKLP